MNAAARFTPGPWHWQGNTLAPVHRNPAESDVHSILEYDGGYGFINSSVKATCAELEVDRALIAAAPELFTTLQTMLTIVRAMDCEVHAKRPSEHTYQSILAQAEEVLQRATHVAATEGALA